MDVFKRWSQWSGASTNRRIFSASVIIAVLTIFAKLLSTAKESVVAGLFGTGNAVDAFVMASLVPLYVINVVSGSFNSAFIPTYIQVREHEGEQSAQRLISSVMARSLALLTVTTLALLATASLYLPLIASGFTPDKIALVHRLLYLLSPVIILSGFRTIWSAVLNAHSRFGMVAISPAITPLTILLFLLGKNRWGISSLAFGMVCGTILETVLVGVALKRTGIFLCPRWHRSDPRLAQVISQTLPMIAGSFLMYGTGFIDQSMAAMLGAGSVASLNYGNRIVSVVLSTSAAALGTAVIPHFSRMVATRDWAGVRHTMRKCHVMIFLTAIPLTILMVLISEPLTRFLYQRGSFTVEDTHIVSQIQIFLALQTPFYMAGIIVVRMISSMRANHILMIGSAINLIVCASLNFFFMKQIGIRGIALSTSCVYLVSFLFLYVSWTRMVSKQEKNSVQ